MPTRLTRISAAVAVLLALAAGLGLALWPCTYRGSVGESGPGGALQERQVCATLVEVHGAGALVVQRDPCREDAHRRLMRCFTRQGQPHLALRQYQACVDALDHELGVDPDPAATALAQQIRLHQPV